MLDGGREYYNREVVVDDDSFDDNDFFGGDDSSEMKSEDRLTKSVRNAQYLEDKEKAEESAHLIDLLYGF